MPKVASMIYQQENQPKLCAFSYLKGLARVRNASDAVGVVLKEIKQQCQLGSFRLLVAVDGVNALWGRTTLKKEDKSPVRSDYSDDVSAFLRQGRAGEGVCSFLSSTVIPERRTFGFASLERPAKFITYLGCFY